MAHIQTSTASLHSESERLVPVKEDALDEEEKRWLFSPGTVASCAVNLAQSALGAGTLAMPFAFKSTGIGIGVVMLVTCAVATMYSVRMLAFLRDQANVVTYEELGAKLIHPKMKIAVATAVMGFCFGITIVYVIAIGDIVHPLTDNDHWPEAFRGDSGKRITTIIFWVLFMWPLSLLKEINSLRFASAFAMVTLLGLVAMIAVHFSLNLPDFSQTLVWYQFDFTMLCALPTIFFSYCCQMNAFEVYHEMNPRTVRGMTKAIVAAMSFATFAYISAGTLGSLDFGHGTKSNILLNYQHPNQTAYIAIAFLGFGFTITFSFPVCLFPPRDAILQLLGYENVYTTPSWTRMLVSTCIAAGSLAVGLFIQDIVVVFNVVGGLCASSLIFVFPSIIALWSGYWTTETVGKTHVLVVWVLLVGGVAAALLGTSIGLYTNITGES